MFSADPDETVTWWTYVVTILIAICIYAIFRQRYDILNAIGFKKATTENSSAKDVTNHNADLDRESDQSIPILTTNDYNQIYSQSSIHRASSRIDSLILAFTKKFMNEQPEFIIRSPGRVNLIGEHIDYCGYNVLPMAIEKDILFAVQIIDEGSNNYKPNIIQLCNRESNKFPAIQIDLSSEQDTTIKLGVENRHWSHYFLAAFKGVENKLGENVKRQYKSLRIMVDGNIPKGSGLSSSSAFVCGAVVCLLYSNLNELEFHKLRKSEIAELCIECERNVGVDSGGMDQTICMMGNKGYAKYIEFRPDLQGFNIKLPSSKQVQWVISNCLLQHQLMDDKGTQNYNTRVVECRLAAVLLAKLLRLKQWRQVLTFRDIQEITKMELDQLLFKTMDLLNNEPYTIEQIEDDLECKSLEITVKFISVSDRNIT